MKLINTPIRFLNLLTVFSLGFAVLVNFAAPVRAVCPTQPSPVNIQIGVVEPISPDRARAANVGEMAAALDTIRQAIPQANYISVVFDSTDSTPADWKAILDVCRSKGFFVDVFFAQADENGNYGSVRPTFVNGQWQTGKLAEFISCPECINHPALYTLATVDEPWKPPYLTTADLKSLYSYLKSLAPTSSFKIKVSFSRQIWRRLVQDNPPNPAFYWDRGICDVVQISTLEFQDGIYNFDWLDSNHFWSRKKVHETTPDIPMWTTAQVFGARYGPGAGYWFPRESDGFHDVRTMLDDITKCKYQNEHQLTGMIFQKWDSDNEARRAAQYTLADKYLPAQPPEQASASTDALNAINSWIRANAPSSVADFDGDGKADISVYRPTGGIWYLQNSTTGFSAFPFGVSTDIITPGDFDGDKKTDAAVFRPKTGTWYVLRSTDGGFNAQAFGLSGDKPVPGDYDGDGKADFAVYRPGTGVWYIQRSSDGAAQIVPFGISEDKPVPADYDGDGRTDIAVYRPGTGVWHVLRSSNNSYYAAQFGIGTDIPVAGDYDGDGKADLAVYRGGTWYVLKSFDAKVLIIAFGLGSDIPAPADFDGDRKVDFTVFRPSAGAWYVLRSTDGSFRVELFGQNEDVPAPASYFPQK